MIIYLETAVLIGFGLTVLLYVILKSRNRCLWRWDGIDNCWRTQCNPSSRFIGYCKGGRLATKK